MIPKLSEEQRQALAQQPGEPLPVEDPDTHEKWVLVKMHLFQQMQQAIGYDASEPDPREFAPMMHHVLKEDWDAPGMEVYDNYQPPSYDTTKDAS